MKIEYVPKNFKAAPLRVIEQANNIIEEYESEGYSLTLRQLYYQFVSRDYIANTMQEYKKLGAIINDARLAGLISWEAIEDRTRNLAGTHHFESPDEIISDCVPRFKMDKWADQEYRPEVWVEKDALIGVIERVCVELDLDYFSCRGYTSQSEMWSAGQRMKRYKRLGQTPVIIHLGDHDPSGIDMSRDIDDRLEMFMGGMKIDRIALNIDQVHKYKPPPNPAKIEDPRASGYIKTHGTKSWELDALNPKILHTLIKKTVLKYRDEELWDKAIAEEQVGVDKLEQIVENLKNEG